MNSGTPNKYLLCHVSWWWTPPPIFLPLSPYVVFPGKITYLRDAIGNPTTAESTFTDDDNDSDDEANDELHTQPVSQPASELDDDDDDDVNKDLETKIPWTPVALVHRCGRAPRTRICIFGWVLWWQLVVVTALQNIISWGLNIWQVRCFFHYFGLISKSRVLCFRCVHLDKIKSVNICSRDIEDKNIVIMNIQIYERAG